LAVDSAYLRPSTSSGESGGVVKTYPINRGQVDDIDGVEAIVRQVLYGEAGWPEEPLNGYHRNVVLVEPPMQPRATREALAKMFFETFQVTNYFSIDAAAASLYAVGKTSGIVVDVGYDRVDVTPVLEGVVHASSAVRIGGFGGHAMTELVAAKHGLEYDEAEAKKRGYMVNKEEEIKSEDDAPNAPSLEDLLGDQIGGHIRDIGSACVNASMISLVAGEREWRRTLMDSIFVCGGGSRVAGFGPRLFADVLEKHAAGFKPSVVPVPDHLPEGFVECASWYGGHLIAGIVMKDQSVRSKHCVTRTDYRDHGARAIWRKLT